MNSGLTAALGCPPLRTSRFTARSGVYSSGLANLIGGGVPIQWAMRGNVWLKGVGGDLSTNLNQSAPPGAPRGIGSLDLQLLRSASTQVTAGSYAIALGSQNTASSSFCVSIGNSNSTTGNYSMAFGYANNSSGTVSIAFGNTCTASADSAIASGSLTTASAGYSFAAGQYSFANRIGQSSQAAGRFAATGDAQASRLVLRVSTTNATQTEMTLDGGAATGSTIATANRLILDASSTWMVDVYVTGRSTSGTNNGCYHRRCLIKRDGSSNTVLVGAVQTVGTDIESDAAWDVTLAADDTNESLQVLVTGVAATTIRWVARVEIVQVSL